MLLSSIVALCQENTASYWVAKGDDYSSNEFYDDAIKAYNKAIEIDPNATMAWYNKGINLKNLGKYNEAIECFNKTIELNPQYFSAYSSMGETLSYLGKKEEAITAYDEAIRINPNFSLAWNNKGSVLLDLGKNEEGLKCIDKALEIDPRNALAWFNKGATSGNLGRNEEALQYLNKALEINPNLKLALNAKRVVLKSLGRTDEPTATPHNTEINSAVTQKSGPYTAPNPYSWVNRMSEITSSSAPSTPATGLKTYSVDAGGWHVTFEASKQLYTEIDTKMGTDGLPYYMIWIKEDPGSTTRSGSLNLFTFKSSLPVQESMLRYLLSQAITSLKISLNNANIRRINGQDALTCYDWSADFGRNIYCMAVPIDPDSNLMANKLANFLSLLDESTNYEIYDSLHITPPSTVNSLPSSSSTSPVSFTSSTGDRSWAARGSGTMGRPAYTQLSTTTNQPAKTSYQSIPQSTYNAPDNSGCSIIGNSNTKKFHEPGCSQIPRINPEHRVCFSSASEAIAAGYEHCQKC